ncbi:MAG: DinB family protein [Spirochaetia bacterium]|jgi:uncharacterized damage-inducible protein DinB
MKETLSRLYDHMEWADAVVIETLGRAAVPPEKALEIFAHVLAAGKLWLDRINGMAEAKVAVWPKLTVRDCIPLSKANADAFRKVLDPASEADLERIVSYTTGKGEKVTSALGDILLHVALHGSYHRGQVAFAVRSGGAEPMNTDYILYVRSYKRSS